MAVEIRNTKQADSKGVMKLMADVYDELPDSTWFIEKPGDDALKRTFERKMQLQKAKRIVDNVAVLDGAVIGNCEIVPQDGISLLGIFVDQRYRGSGVGKMMLNQSIREARQMGVKLIVAEVQDSNNQSIGFFMKHGFVIDTSGPVIVERNSKEAKVVRLVMRL